MSHRDFTRVLVESTVNRTFHQMEKDPRRGLRSLVDLGLTFTHTRFQQPFLELAQTMLQNEDSAYYDLIDHLVRHVNQDTMRTVGVNIGYEGLTKGAKVLRQTIAEGDFQIPWVMLLHCGPDGLNLPTVQRIVQQGTELGVFCYGLEGAELSLEDAEELSSAQPRCAFILLTTGENLIRQNFSALSTCHNIFVGVEDDENLQEVSETLAAGEYFYGIFKKYACQDCVAEEKLRADLDRYYDLRPAVVLYMPGSPEASACSPTVYDTLKAVRMEQKYPFVLLEELGDNLHIAERISSGYPCFLEIRGDGSSVGYTRGEYIIGGDIRHMELKDVLRAVLPKPQMRQASGQ